jgi:hypothetical protein
MAGSRCVVNARPQRARRSNHREVSKQRGVAGMLGGGRGGLGMSGPDPIGVLLVGDWSWHFVLIEGPQLIATVRI